MACVHISKTCGHVLGKYRNCLSLQLIISFDITETEFEANSSQTVPVFCSVYCSGNLGFRKLCTPQTGKKQLPKMMTVMGCTLHFCQQLVVVFQELWYWWIHWVVLYVNEFTCEFIGCRKRRRQSFSASSTNTACMF